MADFFKASAAFAASQARVLSALSAGSKKATAADIKSQEIRDLANAGFAEGDIFILQDGEVWKRTVQGNTAYCNLVTLKDGSVRELYLSQLSRSVIPYVDNENATLPPVRDDSPSEVEKGRAKGTAVAAWKACGNAEEGLKALSGKYIKVTRRETVHTYITTRKTVRDQVVYDFDFISEEEANKE